MDETPQPVDAATLKYLRILVTVLTVTMIAGLLVIITLFVIKFSSFSAEPADPLQLPDTIDLPDGVNALTFTKGTDWHAVVTGDNRILIYDSKDGKLRQTIIIE